MKTLAGSLFFVTFFLCGHAFAPAQESKARAVEPIRVLLTAPDGADEYDRELVRLVGAGLRRRARVAFVSRGADFDVTLSAGPLSEGAECAGVVGAMLVIDERGKRRLSIHTGSDLKALARHLVEKLETEYTQKGSRRDVTNISTTKQQQP